MDSRYVLVNSNQTTLNKCIDILTTIINNDISEFISNDLSDIIIDYINNVYETKNNCKLYNKTNIINEIKNQEKISFDFIKNLLLENSICQIEYNNIFNSDLQLNWFFNKDDIKLFFQNKIININELSNIRTLLENNEIKYQGNKEIYIELIMSILELLLNKNPNLKYHCTEFPIPYQKLFDIKSQKLGFPINPNYNIIINGNNFKTNDDLQIIESLDGNTSNSLSPKSLAELDNYHRMEVMSYLNDDQVIKFLELTDKIDTTDKEKPKYNDSSYVVNYIRIIIENFKNIDNKIVKFYLFNKLFKIVLNNFNFMKQHNIFRKIISDKIIEVYKDIEIINSTGTTLADDFNETLVLTIKFIDDIEIELNPNYISPWKDKIISQKQILENIKNSSNPNMSDEEAEDIPELEDDGDYISDDDVN
jgi:hypothetical protein